MQSAPEREPASERETLRGVLESITFHSEDTGFTVGRLAPEGRASAVTVVGNLPGIAEGQPLRLEGHWIEHPRFGRQFQVEAFEPVRPTRRDGILKYLASGLVRGIGPTLAERIVGTFGDQTLDVIDQHPERLGEVPGIGRKRVTEISRALAEQRGIQEVMVFLRGHGLGAATAARVVKRYGPKAAELVRSNPYRLADEVFGIGFKTADGLAEHLGIRSDSPDRIQAGIVHVLGNATREGHCFLPLDRLRPAAAGLLGVDPAAIEPQAAALHERGEVVVEDRPVPDCRAVYPVQLHQAEVGLHAILAHLLGRVLPPLPIRTAQALAWWQKEQGTRLADGQQQALAAALAEPFTVITGGPGVGKTTIVRALAEFLARKQVKLLLAAPTGRAARRLAEATGRTAVTVHRLLEFQPGVNRFHRDADHPLEGGMLLVDEASMLDLVLAYHLFRAVPPGMRVVLVGDADQLPSVGPGNVLRDLIESTRVAVVRLTEVFRQGAGSLIVENAHRILHGELPRFPKDGGDCFFVAREDPEAALDTVAELCCRRIPERFGLDPIRDIQVITPMYRGAVGADRINRRLQDELNPATAEIERAGHRFRVGDKVMQVRNDYDREVFNGDHGTVLELRADKGAAVLQFDGRAIEYPFADLDQVVPAYAISVHRSQGCEFPAVVIPVSTQHHVMLRRNLLYTAVTRARRVVVIVGSPRALGQAVRNDDVAERFSALRDRLRSRLGG